MHNLPVITVNFVTLHHATCATGATKVGQIIEDRRPGLWVTLTWLEDFLTTK